jgi:hypothetical protein
VTESRGVQGRVLPIVGDGQLNVSPYRLLDREVMVTRISRSQIDSQIVFKRRETKKSTLKCFQEIAEEWERIIAGARATTTQKYFFWWLGIRFFFSSLLFFELGFWVLSAKRSE